MKREAAENTSSIEEEEGEESKIEKKKSSFDISNQGDRI
jgi:hypothetical protein